MKLTRAQWLILVGALLTIAIQVVTNIATDQMPEWIKPCLWLAWPLLGLLTVLFLIVTLRQPTAGPRPLDRKLVQLYLREVAARPVRDLQDRELAYVPREARERRPELFPRRVTAYRRPVSGTEVGGPGFAEPIESVLARQRRLVLLGDPGAGKTTTLRHLARKAAERALADSGPVPVYVELKRYDGQADLAPLLAQAVNEALAAHRLPLSTDPDEAARMVQAWLGQGEFLLLLDGLNEVHPDHRTAAVAALKGLLAGPHQVVVSCRERDYSAELQALAPAYTLQPLSEEEIRNYLERDLGERGEALFWQIRRDRRLLDLAGNPLMLWLMARVAEAEPKGRLPANRGRLLARFVDAMPGLRRREAVPLPDIPDDDVRAALRALGLAMQERGRLEASLSEARAWTAWSGPHDLALVLRAAKGLRFLKSDGRWGEPVAFLHPLFQEYFAAEALRVELEATRDYAAVLGDRPFTGEWDEVIAMLAGVYSDPISLVKWLATEVAARQQGHAALLAHRCWKTSDAAGDVGARTLVIKALIRALRDPDEWVQEEAAEALGKIGKPAVEPLIGALGDPHGWVRSGAAWALREIGDVRAVEPLIGALRDSDENVRWVAVVALGKIGDVRAVEPLIEALGDQDEWVRYWAALALGVIGEARALPELERVAQEDQSESVAEAARRAAERIRKRMGRSTDR